MTTSTDVDEAFMLRRLEFFTSFMRRVNATELNYEGCHIVLGPEKRAEEAAEAPTKGRGKPGRDGMFADEQELMYGRIVDAQPED